MMMMIVIDGEREGVGEERAVTAGETGDDFSDTWRGGGGPCGAANFSPETRFPREGVELLGGGGGGGEGWPVQAGQDVGPYDVGMDGGDRRRDLVIDGVGRRHNRGSCFGLQLIPICLVFFPH